jgi:transcriptional regulator with XRE-family HTH domain
MAKTLYRTENSVLRRMLRDARERAGLTQVDVSKSIGKSQTFLSDVERGVRRLDVIELWEICQAMGVDLSDFIAQFQAELTRVRPARPTRARPSGTPRRRD